MFIWLVLFFLKMRIVMLSCFKSCLPAVDVTHNPKLGGGVPLSLSAIYCGLLTVSTSLAYE